MSIDARNRHLPDWFARVRTRQTVLPRFQRFEAWDHARIAQLFNTVLSELPAGATLVLEVGDKPPFHHRTLEGAPTTGERITEHLLDGQQRLTALWRGLNNNYEDRTYFLFLKPEEETKRPCYVDSIARWKKAGDKELRPFWANEPAEQWSKRMIPLQYLMPDVSTQPRFKEWLKKAIPDAAEREEVNDQVAEIRQKFVTCNLPVLFLPSSTDPQTALDVFIKMNTTAAPLSMYDIVVAQVEAGTGLSLHDLVAETRRACPDIGAYYPVEDLALFASALMQGKPPTNSTYMDPTFGPKLLEGWERFVDGASRTVAFLEEERIFDSARLPSEVVVPVLVALWGLAPAALDAEGRARTILRKYLWRAFFTNRYEKATNGRALADVTELKPLLTSAGMNPPSIFDDALHPLPSVEELMGAKWPVRKDRLARAILALALKKGGLDLADGSTATRGNLSKREYHHLFPDAHLTRQGVPESEVYVSLNCALVTWRTNRNISAKAPERYLAERREGTDLGEPEIRARLATHLIPYDEMVANDYPAFIKARAERVHAEMTRICATGGTQGT